MKKNIILLTGNELRHKYFASFLSTFKNINLKLTVHESNVKLKKNILYKKDKLIKKHVDLRNKSEILISNFLHFFKVLFETNKTEFLTAKIGNVKALWLKKLFN